MVFLGSPFGFDDAMYSWGNPFFSSGGQMARRPLERSYRSEPQSCYDYDSFMMPGGFFDAPRPQYQCPNNWHRQQRSPEQQYENPFHQYRTLNSSYTDDNEVVSPNQCQIPLSGKQEAARLGGPATRNSNKADQKSPNPRNGKGHKVSSEEESTSEDDGVQHVAQSTPKQTPQTTQQKDQESRMNQQDGNPSKAPPCCKPAGEVNNEELQSSDVAQTTENKSTLDESPIDAKTAEDEFHDCSSDLPVAQTSRSLNKKLSNAEKLKSVDTELAALEERINAFNGEVNDKEYIYLDEMLTKALLALDAIDYDGVVEFRNGRKQLVNCVQSLVDRLESKVRLKVEIE